MAGSAGAIDFERPVLEQLGLKQGCVFVKDNLVIVALQHERRSRNKSERELDCELNTARRAAAQKGIP